MIYLVKINSVKTVDELEGSWTNDDFTELLKRFDYADAGNIKQNELEEFLFMAISDFDPDEAAAIVLDYKLSEVLAQGQIDNLSHEMTREKVSENYSDIYIHKILFNINELLFKAYNGKFPHTNAVIVEFEIKAAHEDDTEITKELVLKALSNGLLDNNLINRLFKDQLDGNAAFPEAEGIIWDLQHKSGDQYVMTTSKRWLSDEDFATLEFEGVVTPFILKSAEE